MIALDTSSQGIATGTSPLVWSHTCTGSNLILWVSVIVASSSGSDCSAVTYNGVSMSLAGSKVTNSLIQTSLWYLVAPAIGTNDVSVSFSTTGASLKCHAGAVSYTGALQSGQPDATNTASGNSATGVTVTTVADNCWVVGIAGRSGTIVPSANQTSRQALATSSTTAKGNLEDTNGVVTPAGNQTLSWTGGSTGWAMVGASFSPAADITTSTSSTSSSTSTSSTSSSTSISTSSTSTSVSTSTSSTSSSTSTSSTSRSTSTSSTSSSISTSSTSSSTSTSKSTSTSSTSTSTTVSATTSTSSTSTSISTSSTSNSTSTSVSTSTSSTSSSTSVSTSTSSTSVSTSSSTSISTSSTSSSTSISLSTSISSTSTSMSTTTTLPPTPQYWPFTKINLRTR